MKKVTPSLLLLPLLFIFSFYTSNAQDDIVVESYENYTEAPREIAFAHLNKSTYVEGELMGFTAYIFDKYTKEISQMTKNLYCTITDEKGNVIKKKLVQVENGISHNVFDVDSTLASGVFTFKAYTNWMRNFDEQNHFEQTFKVVDADNNDVITPVKPSDYNIDLQILGEGGHIVYGIPNTVGIIAKNQFGNGIKNVSGNITDGSGKVITDFTLNEYGLGKTILNPEKGKTYKANINFNQKTVTAPIKDIKNLGFSLSLSTLSDVVRLFINSNANASNEVYKVALHNGSQIITSEFQFKSDGTAILSFLQDELFSGVNIFTIFNSKNQPILERLFFNKKNINMSSLSLAGAKASNDSISISLNPSTSEAINSSNISISVLPTASKSYSHHNSIVSQLYLQPYLNGLIENGSSYFKSDDRRTNYNLDLLMLTQGWSSYNWNTILADNEKEYKYPFERGIDIVANVNKQKVGSYVVYPLAKNNTQLFDVPKNEDTFTIKTTFPTEDDLFRIGYINTAKKKFNEKPSLYLQFFPSEFPPYNNKGERIIETFIDGDANLGFDEIQKTSNKNKQVTELDEVVIKAEKRKSRLEALEKKALYGRVDLIEDNIKLRNMRLDLYLQRLGWVTQFDYFSGTLSIINPRVQWGNPVPLVYVDDALLSGLGRNSDFSLLTFLNMGDIDYIEHEFYGVNGGVRGNAGYIKIYTSPGATPKGRVDNTTTYEIPLKFSGDKTFYAPKYKYYNSDFFLNYGVIDWKSSLSFDDEGNISFSIPNTQTENISLFIEGVINGKTLISQEIKMSNN